MKKQLIVASAFFILLSILLLGCKNSASENPGIVETLRISSECAEDSVSIEKCCEEQCREFCRNNNAVYSKHMPNIIHCACWCN